MYFWQVISCNLFLNKNVKIAGKNCKIRKTFWCTVKVQWLTTSICWLSKGQWKYRGKWDAGKTCTFGSRNICSVEESIQNWSKQDWKCCLFLRCQQRLYCRDGPKVTFRGRRKKKLLPSAKGRRFENDF